MKIEPRHRNAAGIIMGGAIFTLADFAFAVASNHEKIRHCIAKRKYNVFKSLQRAISS